MPGRRDVRERADGLRGASRRVVGAIRRRTAARRDTYGPAFEPLEGRRLFCGQALINAVGMSFWGNDAVVQGHAPDGPSLAGLTDAMQSDSTEGSVGSTSSLVSVAADPVGPNGMPLLSSVPGAPTAVFLDFDGYISGGSTTLPYDTDGNAATFSAGEQADIREAWRHVSSYFSMFNTNVTTVQPSVPHSWSMITNSNTGVGYSYMQFDVSYPGSYNPSGDARGRQSGIAHEVGHNFGLSHQSDWDLFGEKIREYSSGYDNLHGPLMGVDYAQSIHKWFIGHPSDSPSSLQDDVAMIANKIRSYAGGDGMRADDHPNLITSPRVLSPSGGVHTAAGVIERIVDIDAFSFNSVGGRVTIDVVPPNPSGLDARVELYSNGALVAAADGSNNDQHLNLPYLAPGSYVVAVRSHGDYGDLGAYDLRVTTLSGVPGPTPTYNTLPGPANLALARGVGTAVTAGWDAVPGATGYAVDRSSDGVTWTQIRTTAGNAATSISDTAVNGGRRYFYRVAALDGTGRSVPTPAAHLVTRPSAVSSLTVTSWKPDALILNWRDVAGESGYRIERETSVGSGTWTTIGTVGVNVPSHTATGLSAGTSYRFRVVATNALGDSLPAEATGVARLPAVTGLAFTAREPTRLALRWNPQAAATNYRVQRSTNGQDFDTVVTLPAGITTYEDRTVQPVKEYFYRVVAVNGTADGVLGTPVFCATPAAAAQALPAPWSDRDVGTVGGLGATGHNNGTFTVLSSGNDIWAEADAFHYTYQPLVGDGEIVARVASQEYTSGWAKAGVMVRETLLPGSRHAMMVVTPDNGTAFQYRNVTNDVSTNVNTQGPFAPYWVRLVRQGNTFVGYRSSDGASWTEQGRVQIPVAFSAYVGLAVVPGDNTDLANVSFTNVAVSNRAPTLSAVAVATPSTVTTRTTSLSVLGHDDHGEANLRYNWSAPQVPAGASAPQFSAQGVNAAKSVTATFARAGTYLLRVTVTDSGGLSVTSDVTVQVVSTPTTLGVTPADPVVGTGEELQFAADLLDQFGEPLAAAPPPYWSASGGYVDEAGLYRAPTTPGQYVVVAEAGGFARFVNVTVVRTDVTAPTLSSAASSKRHGRRGTFDLALRLDAAAADATIEPRLGGAATLRFTFDEVLVSADGVLDAGEFVIAGATFASASFVSVPGVYVLTLNLAAVANGGAVTVTLDGLTDAAGNALAGDRDVSVRSLVGDVDGSGRVDGLDAMAVRGASLAPGGAWNYLLDLDVNGTINVLDQLLVRRNSSRVLAPGA